MTDDQRTRTYSWQDPMTGATAALGMTGLEYLQAMASGQLPPPPIMSTLGFEQGSMTVEPGKVVFSLRAQEYHYNPIGSVHGGVLATLLDSAVACAIQSRLPAGTVYTTLELKVNFTRAVRASTGLLRCEGTVLHLGKQVATAEGRIVDPEGRLCAHATTTCLILQTPPGPGA